MNICIFGSGAIGSYIGALLMKNGIKVSLICRGEHLKAIQNKGLLKLHYADLTDSSSISTLVSEIMPDEVYNLGAQSHVAVSFKNPILSTQVGNIGTLSLLEAIKSSDKQIKFYQASSSEMYGGGSKKSLNEDSIFDPKSPYAASKASAELLIKSYITTIHEYFGFSTGKNPTKDAV